MGKTENESMQNERISCECFTAIKNGVLRLRNFSASVRSAL